MQQALVRFLASIGALVVLLVVFLVLASALGGSAGVPDRVLLELDLTQPVIESAPTDSFSQLVAGRVITLRGAASAIERAAKDERVVGMVARVGTGPKGLATIEELREALAVFSESGKPMVAYAEQFDYGSSGTANYYLASAFDRLYLQPLGTLGFSGLGGDVMFLRGAFDKLGVVPQMDRREEYKSAKNTYTEKQLSPQDEEALGRMLESQLEAIVTAVAKDRELSPDALRKLADKGLFSSQAALEAKLVDGVAYRAQVYDELKEKLGETERLSLDVYATRTAPSRGREPVVAVIYGVGGVSSGESQADPFFGASMGSDTVAQAFRDAVEDEDVRAIVFRVNSPGGSAVASQVIWEETRRARAAGKPVIVTMGDLAASGGYYVAMAADKIVAHPSTLTGSIGVYSGKLVTREAWGKLGITYDGVRTSTNSHQWSELHDFTPEQWQALQGVLDDVYDQFTRGVAEGRGLPIDKVREVAKGRVWTGADAMPRGLVDELGGFPTAIRLAREAADLGKDEEVWLEEFPRPRSVLDTLIARMTGVSEASASEQALHRMLRLAESVEPLADVLRELDAGQDPIQMRAPLLR